MESSRVKIGKAVMELIGTAMLVATIQIAVFMPFNGLGPLAIGGVLTTIVYAGGPISGAHYNPAVSLAVMLRRKMTFVDMLVYWLFQIVGGFIGALIGGLIVGGDYGSIAKGEFHSYGAAFLAESVFTFWLCFVVLSTATSSKAADNHYYGAAIGLVVTVGAITVGPISGGAFNPAVALALAFTSADDILYALAVVLFNLLGAIVAAACFFLIDPSEFNSTYTTVPQVEETDNVEDA